MDAHGVLSVKHWDRIGHGSRCAGTSAVRWAILHARTLDLDVLRCGSWGGGLRVAIINAEMIMQNAEMQKLQRGHVHAAIGAAALGVNAGGWVRPVGGNLRELRELIRLRFWVDVGSQACDSERDA